ncbi:hypothetical protein [Solidesulfovibrio sp. C21]|uniref:hypothetical protein n=1 Tax=Solidesulfovibrio sp. C21 TaxID=3398613 RepID=UPI0039FC7C5F
MDTTKQSTTLKKTIPEKSNTLFNINIYQNSMSTCMFTLAIATGSILFSFVFSKCFYNFLFKHARGTSATMFYFHFTDSVTQNNNSTSPHGWRFMIFFSQFAPGIEATLPRSLYHAAIFK